MNRLLALLLFGTACAAEEEGPSFAEIDEGIFRQQCTYACHSGGEFAAGGLDMATDPHGVLIDRPPTATACRDTPMLRVVPGDPDASLLYVKIVAKIDAAPPPCGDTMPLGPNRPSLSPEQVDLIRAWIDHGALPD
jgi:hypothetical protein